MDREQPNEGFVSTDPSTEGQRPVDLDLQVTGHLPHKSDRLADARLFDVLCGPTEAVSVKQVHGDPRTRKTWQLMAW